MLQRQVDDLDELKAHYYQEIMEHEEEIWDFVQGKVSSIQRPLQRSFALRYLKICLVVRSSMDVFDRFTAKAYASHSGETFQANLIAFFAGLTQ